MNNDKYAALKSTILHYYRSLWIQSLIINLISVAIFLFFNRHLQSMGFFPLNVGYAILITIGFFFPITLAIYRRKEYYYELGFQFSWKGFLLGILVYLPPAIIFIKYQIFTQVWKTFSFQEIIYATGLVCWVVFITDAWHHGFFFLGLLKSRKMWNALVLENIYWFFYHFYEIQVLSHYIGWGTAVIFTMIVGICGDLIAWKFRSVWGLMVGHVFLNLIIIISTIC